MDRFICKRIKHVPQLGYWGFGVSVFFAGLCYWVGGEGCSGWVACGGGDIYAVLPVIVAILWSLVLAPFSFGAGVFYAPASIGAAMLLGACMVIAKRYQMDKTWLLLPALVFIYEMLPINIPGPLDDTFALTGSVGTAIVQFMRRALPKIIKTSVQDISQDIR